MKAIRISLCLLFLQVLILPKPCASKPLLAYIRGPSKHSLYYEPLTDGLEKDAQGRTSFVRIGELLKHKRSDEYILNSYRKIEDIPLNTFHHKENRYTKISEDTKYLAIILATAAASLYMMPEELTKWSREGRQGTNLFERWGEHVRSRPVWDTDEWAVNYIGHPYAGSAYYILARHNGFDWKEAGLYSAFVSTFMWEYGVELTGEVPSIQDLIVTPVGGVILGELLLDAEDAIKRNDGEVLGSRLLGNISLVLIDPAGSAINLLKRWTDMPARIKITTQPFTTISSAEYDETYIPGPHPLSSPYYGMKIIFTYE